MSRESQSVNKTCKHKQKHRQLANKTINTNIYTHRLHLRSTMRFAPLADTFTLPRTSWYPTHWTAPVSSTITSLSFSSFVMTIPELVTETLLLDWASSLPWWTHFISGCGTPLTVHLKVAGLELPSLCTVS